MLLSILFNQMARSDVLVCKLINAPLGILNCVLHLMGPPMEVVIGVLREDHDVPDCHGKCIAKRLPDVRNHVWH